jgi:hypothetical protein
VGQTDCVNGNNQLSLIQDDEKVDDADQALESGDAGFHLWPSCYKAVKTSSFVSKKLMRRVNRVLPLLIPCWS